MDAPTNAMVDAPETSDLMVHLLEPTSEWSHPICFTIDATSTAELKQLGHWIIERDKDPHGVKGHRSFQEGMNMKRELEDRQRKIVSNRKAAREKLLLQKSQKASTAKHVEGDDGESRRSSTQ